MVLSEDLMNSIQQLIMLGKGDRGRLEYILDLLQKGRVLPSSDQKYLESIIPLYFGSVGTESLQKHSEHDTEKLYKDIQNLNHKISTSERKGFERYIGKKAVFFFITLFVGWNALPFFTSNIPTQFISYDLVPYLFPLSVFANYFNADSLVLLIFILMILAWPFIGVIHLIKFISARKLSNEL